MCGIVGFTGAPDTNKLTSMLSSITHRGPDDSATLEEGGFSLGMRRLAIIDLSSNLYPMPNEDNTIFCILNGEIYNYRSVREDLIARGHVFKTESDSEVIVHGYEEWGHEVLAYLRGMFVFALYDKHNNEMFIARDRLGIKPLYYTEHENRIIFASELKALFAGWDVPRVANDQVVYRFLLTRVHDDEKETFFDGVKRLMPAHYMVIEGSGNYRIQRYWYPEVNTEFRSRKSDEEYAMELKERFMESMELHLIADVPVGVNLSGGLDSSGVTAAASQLLKSGTDLHTEDKLHTFSAIHPGESIDESEYIDEVLKETGAVSHKIIPSVDTFWEEVEDWVYFQEEPTISTAPYAYYVVMREAHHHVTVLLSGQGGDELFAGYIPYFMSYIQTAKDAGAYWEILRESIKGIDLYSRFIKQKINAKLKSTEQLSMSGMLNKPEDFDTSSLGHVHLKNLNERLRFDLTAGSVPNLLRYEDKNSMAHSLESRVPFLDHVFVEYALSLPADQKIKHGWNRYAYRNAMRGVIPEKIRSRRSKVGFVNSEWEWIKEKADLVKEIFNSEAFRSRPYWNADKVISEFDAAVSGHRQGDWLIFWRILSVELWLRGYIDQFTPR